MDDHWRLLSADRVERFSYTEALVKDKDCLIEALVIWLSLWRDVLLHTIGASASPLNLDRQAEIEQLATQLKTEQVYQVVTSIESTLESLSRNINPRLAVEVLMLDLPYR